MIVSRRRKRGEERFLSFYDRCSVKEESCDRWIDHRGGEASPSTSRRPIFTIGSDRVLSDHKQVGIATTCVLLGRQVRQRSNPNVIIAAIEVRDLIIVVIIAIVRLNRTVSIRNWTVIAT